MNIANSTHRTALSLLVGSVLAFGFDTNAIARASGGFDQDRPQLRDEQEDRAQTPEQARKRAAAAREQAQHQAATASGEAQRQAAEHQAGQAAAMEQASGRRERREALEARRQAGERAEQQRQSALRPPVSPPITQPPRPARRAFEQGEGPERRADRARIDEQQRAELARQHEDRSEARETFMRRQRLSDQQQQQLIARQQQQALDYRRDFAARQALAQQQAVQLQQQRRMAQHRYEQEYFERLRRQRARMDAQRYDYARDPYFHSPSIYRYAYGGYVHDTNRYGADLLRQAVNNGYETGVRVGLADRLDGWRPDYRGSYAYQDANYGYDGYYVSQADYNYYFRQGFRRGYEDGYYGRDRYGRHDDNSASILAAVLAAILNLQLLR